MKKFLKIAVVVLVVPFIGFLVFFFGFAPAMVENSNGKLVVIKTKKDLANFSKSPRSWAEM